VDERIQFLINDGPHALKDLITELKQLNLNRNSLIESPRSSVLYNDELGIYHLNPKNNKSENDLQNLAFTLNKNLLDLITRLKAEFRLAKKSSDALLVYAQSQQVNDLYLYLIYTDTLARLSDQGAWPLIEASIQKLEQISIFLSGALMDMANGKSNEVVSQKLLKAQGVLISMQKSYTNNQDLQRYRSIRNYYFSQQAKLCQSIF
nr:hypothetical protein [Pseudobdellovibrionaceae bacterium]